MVVAAEASGAMPPSPKHTLLLPPRALLVIAEQTMSAVTCAMNAVATKTTSGMAHEGGKGGMIAAALGATATE